MLARWGDTQDDLDKRKRVRRALIGLCVDMLTIGVLIGVILSMMIYLLVGYLPR
jgi:hypothetical protein